MTLEQANQKRDALLALLELQDTKPEEFMQRLDELVPLALDTHDAFIEIGRIYTAFNVLLLAVHPKLQWVDKCQLSNQLVETVELHDYKFYFDGRIHHMREQQLIADFIMGGGDSDKQR